MRILAKLAVAALAVASLLGLGIVLGTELVDALWPHQPSVLASYRDVWPGSPQPTGVTCHVVVDSSWYLGGEYPVTSYCLVGLRRPSVRSAGVYVSSGVVTKLVLSVRGVQVGDLALDWGQPSRTWSWTRTLQVSWPCGGYAIAVYPFPKTFHADPYLAQVSVVIWSWQG